MPEKPDLMWPLFPDFRQRVALAMVRFEAVHDIDIVPRITLRTFALQQNIYNQGRTTPGKRVTNAKPGYSAHNYGIALDIVFSNRQDPYLESDPRGEWAWDAWGEAAEAEGLEWGGRWQSRKDRPHVECRYGYSMSQIRELFNDGGIEAVWRAFDEKIPENKRHSWSLIADQLVEQGFGKPSIRV